MENIDIISLGGVGGCDITYALKELNCLTYPFSWIVSSQSFVIKSFNSFENFYDFDPVNVHSYHKRMIHNGDKTSVMLHDFNNFDIERDNVIAKYKRRFERFNETLNNKKKLLFVRLLDNLSEPMLPPGLYDNFYKREEEDIGKWNIFFKNVCSQYPEKEIHFLIVTNMMNKVVNKPDNLHKNLHLIYTENYKDKNTLVKLFKSVLQVI
jgi:hypothetical protein